MRCLLPYQNPTDSLLKRLKYNGETGIAAALGGLLADYLESYDDPLVDGIIAVPLHPFRLWQRGFNQAVEIAKPISKKFNIPILSSLCYRTHITQDQAALQHHQRKANVDNAFALRENSLCAEHIAIIDDVITTGSTITAVANSFQKLDVSISTWACARTLVPLIRN